MHYLFYKARWYIGVALLLCLAITVMKYSAWIDRKFFGNSRQPANVSQQTAPGGLPSNAISSTNQHSLLASPSSPSDIRTQLGQAQSLLNKASNYASDALEQTFTWESEIESLNEQAMVEPLAGEEGGETSKLFDRLAYVVRRERTSAEELREATTKIESLQAKVENLMNQSSPAALSPIDLADISQLHATSKNASEDWKRDVEQALAIKHLIETQSQKADSELAPTTVGGKLKDAKAQAALDALENQIEREAEEEETRRELEAQEAELLARATSPEVKAILVPFLQPRDVQPRMSGASIAFTRTTDKKPMSLSALYGINALGDSIEGLKRLAKLGGHRKLSEPRWSVHSQPNNWSEDDKAMLQEAQQLLRDYGPVLVKAGLLSE